LEDVLFKSLEGVDAAKTWLFEFVADLVHYLHILFEIA
jgi:hypothetical protein